MGEAETALGCLQQSRHSRSLPRAPGAVLGWEQGSGSCCWGWGGDVVTESQHAPVCFASDLVWCQGWVGICMEQKKALSPHCFPGGKSNTLCPRGYHVPSARGMDLPGETSERKIPIPFSSAIPNTTAEPNTALLTGPFPTHWGSLGEQGAKPAQPLAQGAPKKPNPVCRDAAPAGLGGMRLGAATAASVQHPKAGGFWSPSPFP